MIKNGILSYPTVPLSSSLDWVLQSQLKNIQVADIKPYVPSLSDTITELRKSLPLNNTLARQEFNDEIAKIKNNALDFTVTLANGTAAAELPEEYYRKIACDIESAIELAKKDQRKMKYGYCVYVLVTEEWSVFYVGMTINPKVREAKHKQRFGNTLHMLVPVKQFYGDNAKNQARMEELNLMYFYAAELLENKIRSIAPQNVRDPKFSDTVKALATIAGDKFEDELLTWLEEAVPPGGFNHGK